MKLEYPRSTPITVNEESCQEQKNIENAETTANENSVNIADGNSENLVFDIDLTPSIEHQSTHVTLDAPKQETNSTVSHPIKDVSSLPLTAASAGLCPFS